MLNNSISKQIGNIICPFINFELLEELISWEDRLRTLAYYQRGRGPDFIKKLGAEKNFDVKNCERQDFS